MINKVKQEVIKILKDENSGHGIDHIERVLNLSLKFCETCEVNQEIVALIALLHDVDDYKLFGEEHATHLYHAHTIMDECAVEKEIQNLVCDEIKRIGYSKSLNGIRPKTLEGMIVSDADMCDALGAHGIIRCYTFSMKKNQPFFDRNVFPKEELSSDEYKESISTSVNHMFEKILKLKQLMLTNEGKIESEKRHVFILQFLKQYFEEENANEWIMKLDQINE